MDKLEEDRNGLQLRFLKTCLPNGFSKFIFAVCDVSYNAWRLSPCIIVSFFLFILITQIFSNRLSAATVNRSNFSSSIANNDAYLAS